MASEDNQDDAGAQGQLIDLGRELTADAEKRDDPASPLEPPAETASEFSELEVMARERDQYRERLTCLQAEFDNARERTEREQRELKTVTLAAAMRSLLPISDNLARAMQAPVNSPREFRSGIQLIQRPVRRGFSRAWFNADSHESQIFDPRVHEAIDVDLISASLALTL